MSYAAAGPSGLRRSVTVLLAAAVAIGGLLAGSTRSAHAAGTQCVYTPVLPSKITVGQSVVGLTARLKISGTGCGADFDVSTQLVHSTDSYFLWWDKATPDVESVYAFEVKPGTYRTTARKCNAYDNDFNDLSCTVGAASTVIKFGARARITAARSKSLVTINAVATRYNDYYGYRATTARVSIQRYANGAWHAIHTGTASGRAGLTWKYHHAARARYRVISAETATPFAGTSATVAK
jgi:hypothetical protein